MRVTIQHRETPALVTSTKNYFIDCSVIFSEEEKAIIEARNLHQSYVHLPPATPPVSKVGWYGLPFARLLARLAWVGAFPAYLFSIAVPSLSTLGTLLLIGGGAGDLYFWYLGKKFDDRIGNNDQAVRLKHLLDGSGITIWAATPAAAKDKEDVLRARLNDFKQLIAGSAALAPQQTYEL
jgi:hypothetical protein